MTRRLSARQRIIGMTTIVVALALLVTIVVLRQVLLNEQADRVDRDLTQEARELLEFVGQTEPIDGEDGPTYARRVLTRFLETNVTDRDESLLAVQGGVAFLQSSGAPGDVTALVPSFAATVEPVFVDGSTDAGPVRILAQPLLADGEQIGILAISWFTADERAAIDRVIRDAAIIAAAALVAAVALAWIVAGRALRPIGLLAETARTITEEDLTRRLPEQGSDEIASLIASFNSMVDRLEDLVETQRTFLDDVGHELRTPITVVRGHLELAGTGELGESRDVVLSELDRMSRIVDDLLTLARAGRFEFLRTGPVDTDGLLTSLLPRVGELGDRRWVVDAMPTGVIVADHDRLTQAMLNLASNAARHTTTGDEIGIGGRFDDRSFELWVRDTGEGVDPADLDRIFERFGRGRPREDGGAGLGLAIVRAVAHAHGGDVDVESRPGDGATFTITIPAERPPAGDVSLVPTRERPSEPAR